MTMQRLVPVLLALLFISTSLNAAGPTDWPEFRGPFKNGHTTAPGDSTPVGLATEWSETKNVTWRTDLPNRGWSSPVILDGQIWLTAATQGGNDFFVFCIDVKTGAILYTEKLFHVDEPNPLGNNVNCYASPTVVLEAGRAYVHFGRYGTVCIDTRTFKTLWTRTDLECWHYRGPGSSPITFENLLILSFDGVDVQYTIALDKVTGKNVWRTDRTTVWTDFDTNGLPKRDGDARKAFSTPLVVDVKGKPLMISLGASTAFGYDPKTGREIWKQTHVGHTSSTRPVFGNGLAFITTGYGTNGVQALRVDGEGDVTESHTVWSFMEKSKAPMAPSPILVGDLLYLVNDRGALTCLDSKTGGEVWSERVGGSYYASPIHANGLIYIFSVQGKALVVKAGRKFDLVATNTLDEGCMASPAVIGDAMIVRTKEALYRIEEK